MDARCSSFENIDATLPNGALRRLFAEHQGYLSNKREHYPSIYYSTLARFVTRRKLASVVNVAAQVRQLRGRELLLSPSTVVAFTPAMLHVRSAREKAENARWKAEAMAEEAERHTSAAESRAREAERRKRAAQTEVQAAKNCAAVPEARASGGNVGGYAR